MKKVDFELIGSIKVDVCVVGSGLVGSCIAAELVEKGLSVLVLESGQESPNRRTQSLSDAVITNLRFHEPMSAAVSRSYGGTSRLWGGRCSTLDDIDFIERRYVPHSGWPFGHNELSRFYRTAGKFLALGNEILPGHAGSPCISKRGLSIEQHEYWANETRIFKLLQTFKSFKKVNLILDATVIDIEVDASTGAVEGLVVAQDKKRIIFRGAQSYVLALGGVETARLLLVAKANNPNAFASHKAIGRYYIGHVSGSIAKIKFSNPNYARHFSFMERATYSSRRRLTLSDSVLNSGHLPNIAFWPDNPRIGDPTHKNGFLSAIYLILSIHGLNARLLPEALRRVEFQDPSKYLDHVWNCIIDFSSVIAGAINMARQRFIKGRRLPRWFTLNAENTYPLHFHAEHRPNADNRVTLADSKDILGMPSAKIEFDFSGEDCAGVYDAHVALNEALVMNGIGALEFHHSREDFISQKAGCLADGLHQIGTTRMTEGPQDGVVDRNCKVFGITNLFIAGSAIFPTSGQANPTFPAIAFAMRLAEHLAALQKKRLKILHVISSIDAASGGPSRAVLDFSLASRRRGHDVTICTTDFGGAPVDTAIYLDEGVVIEKFSVGRPKILEYSFGLARYLEGNISKFDIVHLHSLYLFHDWAVNKYARQNNVPYVLRPHGTFDPVIRVRKPLPKWVLGKLFQNKVTKEARGIHYTSAEEQRLSNCDNHRSWVVPIPIRPDEFDGQDYDVDFKSKYKIDNDYILFLGRLDQKKGADILIDSFSTFTKRYPDVDLVIVGPDFGELSKLRAMVQSLLLSAKVHFIGMIDGPSRIAAYKFAKLFALPSRGENFGRTAVEAMLAGVPIVMTEGVGIWPLLAETDSAIIVKPTTESFLSGLCEAWENYRDLLEKAARARRLVKDRFGIEKIGKLLDQMYADVLQRNLNDEVFSKSCEEKRTDLITPA